MAVSEKMGKENGRFPLPLSSPTIPLSIIIRPCLAICCKRNCMFLGNGRFSSPVPISSKSSTRGNYAHGNPYYKLLRTEVAVLAQELHGAAGVKEQAAKHQLRKINGEINSLKLLLNLSRLVSQNP
ncbi:MAG: hypothetical protein GY796_04875 [Chloroflexi bacterium]|nr:hypothetical protein [Chloroflexota bacterium]